MDVDEHKSIKQVDQELADRAAALEEAIKQAEAKHPGQVEQASDDTDHDDLTSPP